MSFETAFAVVGFVVVGVLAFAGLLLWDHVQTVKHRERQR